MNKGEEELREHSARLLWKLNFCETLSGCFSGQQRGGNSTQLGVLPKKSWNLIELSGLCLDTYKTGKKNIVINSLCEFEMHLFIYLIWHVYKKCSEYRCMTLIPVVENYKITEMLFGKDMCKSSNPALCLMQAVANTHLGMDLLGKSEILSTEKFVHFVQLLIYHTFSLFCYQTGKSYSALTWTQSGNTAIRKKKTYSLTSPDFLSLIRHWSCLA